MLLALSFGTAIGILPFTIFRALQHDWYIAALDAFVVIGMSLIFIYVYKTNKVRSVSFILILVALCGNVVSFYLKGISQINWVYPAMLSAYYIMSPQKGMIINFVMLAFYVPKLLSLLNTINVATIIVTVIITNIIAYVFASGLRKQETILKKLASEDYLTGTGNRRALSEKFKTTLQRLQNHDMTATILLLDLDHFKNVNDTHGHIKGDEVLIKLTELMNSHFNSQGYIYRYGGEEFLIVCPNIDIKEAFKKAEDFRDIVKSNIIIDGVEQTISIGVAEYIKEENIDDWIHRVDLALYQAKNQGRDRSIKA
jgi:diguanylate cyclase (GGDEF)-like protein